MVCCLDESGVTELIAATEGKGAADVPTCVDCHGALDEDDLPQEKMLHCSSSPSSMVRVGYPKRDLHGQPSTDYFPLWRGRRCRYKPGLYGKMVGN